MPTTANITTFSSKMKIPYAEKPINLGEARSTKMFGSVVAHMDVLGLDFVKPIIEYVKTELQVNSSNCIYSGYTDKLQQQSFKDMVTVLTDHWKNIHVDSNNLRFSGSLFRENVLSARYIDYNINRSKPKAMIANAVMNKDTAPYTEDAYMIAIEHRDVQVAGAVLVDEIFNIKTIPFAKWSQHGRFRERNAAKAMDLIRRAKTKLVQERFPVLTVIFPDSSARNEIYRDVYKLSKASVFREDTDDVMTLYVDADDVVMKRIIGVLDHKYPHITIEGINCCHVHDG